ncbi:MdlB ABC-type multidrug transport system, ATPase and permease components [Candidatus Nanopelagicaceae bacterium]
MRSILTRIRASALGRALGILPKEDYRKLFLVIVLQVALALLDLIGVALVGVIGALSISGIKSTAPGTRTALFLEKVHLADFAFQTQVAFLGALAALFLLCRTLISVYLTRRILFYLSRRGAQISAELVSKLMTKPLLGIRTQSTQNTLFALTSGVQNITVGILANFVTLIADASLLFILSIGLFAVDAITAISTFFFFGIISLLVYRTSSGRAHKLGSLNSALGVESSESILEVLNAYREISVRNRREYYVRKISETRFKLSNVLAEIQFMPNVSKYVIESSVVLGALMLSAIQFLIQDATHAIGTLAIFLAAGTRIAPAVMRLQQGGLQLRTSAGASKLTLDLVEELKNFELSTSVNDEIDFTHEGFIPQVQIKNASLLYPGSSNNALSNIDLEIPVGASIAIVGPSGAGKTSLVDLLLGVVEIHSGSVLISGETPQNAIRKWPGGMAYVPQDIVIVNGTVRSNLAIGFPVEIAPDDKCWEALDAAQLREYIETLPHGLDSSINEDGSNLSGGQRQRLGIARALFTKPRLLVLDEATSSLDARTEQEVSNSIQSLKGRLTLVTVAHRLSTVRNADLVLYIQDGKVIARGTFEQVREQVKDFDEQAMLMGL